MQWATVRKLSESVPLRLSLVLGSPCRNAHVVMLPRLPYAHYAVRLRSLPPSAPLSATRPATVHTASGCSLPSAAPHSLGGRFRNVLFSPPHVGGSNSCKLACHGSAISPRHTPTSSDTKKGDGRPSPLRVSNCYSSNPATTVSSVDDSNAFAASVTGK